MAQVAVRAALAALALAFSAPGTAARAADAPDVRLGRDVVPLFQSVRLRLDADRPDYSGAIHTELNVATATNVVRLHAEGQTLTRVTLRQGGDSLHVAVTPGEHGLLTLTAERPLAPGAATLDLEFTKTFGTRAVGLYRVTTRGHGYLFTQFESDDAREAFPCWDEPGFKFPYQMTLEVPAAHEAVSNTPVERQSEAGGWKTIEFARTPPLPSYLLAIATGPLEFTEVPGPPIPMRIVTVQGQQKLTATTAATAPRLLTGLERWFGTPYPFAKLDLIAVPEFAYGAMENPGAITFREDILLLDPASVTVNQRGRNASVICHELAHMWFGDLVTMAWWDDLWLNEAFADWMAAKITDQVFPEFKSVLNELQDIQAVKKNDALPSTMAIRGNATSSAAGLQNVGLVYAKGNAVLSTFENYLGPEVFQKGVRAYLKAHAWGNATAGDLWQALDAASGQNVSAAMATFTDQPGLPLVRVTPVDGGVLLSQARNTPWGVKQPPMHWNIPLALRWSDGRSTRVERVMLTKESQVVKLAAQPEWLMPNAGGRGYFAWSLPAPMLETLAHHAKDDLTPAERVDYLGNLDVLLQSGEVHGDTYLRALTEFGADPEPAVVGKLLASVRNLRGAFVPDSLAPYFAPYVRKTLGPALERYGLERKIGEDEAISQVRGELLASVAYQGNDPRVMAFAQDAARRYLADSSSVDPGIVDAVLGLAARKGDAALFAEYQRRFETTRVPLLRGRYLRAMGGFEDPALEARALEYTLSDAVLPTESMGLLRGYGGRNEAAGARLFEWMMTNYDRIARRVPPPALRFLPMMGSGCSEERLLATRTFFADPARGIPGVDKTLERVADGVHGCISLREREGAAVAGYLKSLKAN